MDLWFCFYTCRYICLIYVWDGVLNVEYWISVSDCLILVNNLGGLLLDASHVYNVSCSLLVINSCINFLPF